MSYAKNIGNPVATPTVGDLENKRLARQIEAEKIQEDTPILAHLLRDQIAEWINKGGAKPWENPAAPGVHPYPPIREHRSEL